MPYPSTSYTKTDFFDDGLELHHAKIYAARLANTMRSQIKGLKEDDPAFVLCDDLPGILTQIDNMSAVLSKKYRPGDYN